MVSWIKACNKMLNEVSQREMEGIKMINQNIWSWTREPPPAPTHTLTYTQEVRMLSVLQAKWTELCCSREREGGEQAEKQTQGEERGTEGCGWLMYVGTVIEFKEKIQHWEHKQPPGNLDQSGNKCCSYIKTLNRSRSHKTLQTNRPVTHDWFCHIL